MRRESTIGIYGTGLLDAISDSDLKAEYVRQEQNGVPLNPAIFKNGECLYKSPTLKEIAAYCREEKDTLWDETKRLFYPHRVYVDLSQ